MTWHTATPISTTRSSGEDQLVLRPCDSGELVSPATGICLCVLSRWFLCKLFYCYSHWPAPKPDPCLWQLLYKCVSQKVWEPHLYNIPLKSHPRGTPKEFSSKSILHFGPFFFLTPYIWMYWINNSPTRDTGMLGILLPTWGLGHWQTETNIRQPSSGWILVWTNKICLQTYHCPYLNGIQKATPHF